MWKQLVSWHAYTLFLALFYVMTVTAAGMRWVLATRSPVGWGGHCDHQGLLAASGRLPDLQEALLLLLRSDASCPCCHILPV